MTTTPTRCPECGAVWRDGLTCRDHFDQMLAWEFQDPGGAGAVHHLTVLCYNLQHPRVYSPEGLRWALAQLVDFLTKDLSLSQARQRMSENADSGTRAFKITGTPDSYGRYARPVEWPITIGDVAAGGLTDYGQHVSAWADSVLEALRQSGNIPPT
ncbi:MAG: hypothetical protein JXN59_01060 [Anaerolineae bacterium]|nr:hypothetical protein [Anaerolineae bacterium]